MSAVVPKFKKILLIILCVQTWTAHKHSARSCTFFFSSGDLKNDGTFNIITLNLKGDVGREPGEGSLYNKN